MRVDIQCDQIEGIRIRNYVPGRDERVTYEAVADAFRGN